MDKEQNKSQWTKDKESKTEGLIHLMTFRE